MNIFGEETLPDHPPRYLRGLRGGEEESVGVMKEIEIKPQVEEIEVSLTLGGV